MVLFSASISHFRGVLMDRWDASWLVRVILPSVLSITSPSGRLPLMPLRKKKKKYLETILPAYHMLEFRVSLFGDLGHLCENIAAFKFSLVLLFMLVMSQADCSRDNCAVQSAGCSTWEVW